MNIERNIRGIVKDFTCGFCYSQSGYEIVFSDYSDYRLPYGDLIVAIAIAVVQCRNCGMFNLLTFNIEEDDFELDLRGMDLEAYLKEHPHVNTFAKIKKWPI